MFFLKTVLHISLYFGYFNKLSEKIPRKGANLGGDKWGENYLDKYRLVTMTDPRALLWKWDLERTVLYSASYKGLMLDLPGIPKRVSCLWQEVLLSLRSLRRRAKRAGWVRVCVFLLSRWFWKDQYHSYLGHKQPVVFKVPLRDNLTAVHLNPNSFLSPISEFSLSDLRMILICSLLLLNCIICSAVAIYILAL